MDCRAFGAVAILLTGCSTDHKGRDTGIGADCEPLLGTHSNPDYGFHEGNLTCEEAPSERVFNVDLAAFEAELGFEADDVLTDISSALHSWSSVGVNIKLRLGETDFEVDPTPTTPDFLLGLGAYSGSKHDLYDDGSTSFARAFTWTRNGYFVDCDIMVWGSVFVGDGEEEDAETRTTEWAVNRVPGDTEIDFRTVILHELGHCIGLGDQVAPSLTESVMWHVLGPGQQRPDPDSSDVEAIMSLYGEE